MFHVPRVWHSLPVTPLEVICGWTDDFGDNERSFPGGRKLMHDGGLLNTPQDEVTNIEGSFPNVAIIIPTKLLIVTSLSHDGD
jgi:hypothetical protein